MSRTDDLHSITAFRLEGPTVLQCNESSSLELLMAHRLCNNMMTSL
jgi:hypothetical protein